MELPEDIAERLLERWPVARLATAGPEGPRLLPIVFARAGGRLWSPIDGKPKAGGEPARVRRVRADPRVSLLLDHYEADWSRLWWLRIDAEAAVLQPAAPEADPEVAPALAALRAKYPQYGSTPLLGEPPTLLCFTPLGSRTWCADVAGMTASVTRLG